MKTDTPRLLSVSRAAMGPPKTTASDVRIECKSAGAPPEMAEDEQPPVSCGWSTSGSFCLVVKRREEKSSISSRWLHGGLWISHAAESC